MRTIIYGAGTRGRKTYNLLIKRGQIVDFFCDTYPDKVDIETLPVPLITYTELLKLEDVRVIIAVTGVSDISKHLKKDRVKIISAEEILGGTGDVVENNRNFIAEYHRDEMEDYYDNAENDLERFWNENTDFYKYFKQLDLCNVVELAAGHGRHVTKYIEMAGDIILVDILKENIDFCRFRFGEERRIKYYKNSGYDLIDIPNNSVSSVFSYDAMVHFEMIDIFIYLKEIERILVPGGKALIHHSNNGDYNATFVNALGGRNYMTQNLFRHLCNRANLEVLDQTVIDFVKKESDCLSFVEKGI
jgi:ubiquinone/menaquinone biosynthesis C-methylase UbiE